MGGPLSPRHDHVQTEHRLPRRLRSVLSRALHEARWVRAPIELEVAPRTPQHIGTGLGCNCEPGRSSSLRKALVPRREYRTLIAHLDCGGEVNGIGPAERQTVVDKFSGAASNLPVHGYRIQLSPPHVELVNCDTPVRGGQAMRPSSRAEGRSRFRVSQRACRAPGRAIPQRINDIDALLGDEQLDQCRCVERDDHRFRSIKLETEPLAGTRRRGPTSRASARRMTPWSTKAQNLVSAGVTRATGTPRSVSTSSFPSATKSRYLRMWSRSSRTPTRCSRSEVSCVPPITCKCTPRSDRSPS